MLVGFPKALAAKQSDMKRIGNLYDRICSIENLKLADEKARRGKLRSYGVKLHDKSREENILKLRESLLSQTYKTSKYSIFKIYEPKERDIYRLPYYPDRILHHAIMNILEPIWVSIFTDDTYSCIKGRGIHAAAKRMKRTLRENPGKTKYCLKLDIKKFYPSIDHDLLKNIVRKKVKDERLLNLLDEIIDSASGVPIGNCLSQYFANLYLAYFDHWIKGKESAYSYFRYADDIIVLSPSKESLHHLLIEIREYLTGLKLEIKRSWRVFPVASCGIDFVGYVFYHTHTLLRKGIKKNFCRRMSKISGRDMPDLEYKRLTSPWYGWTKYCDANNLLKKLKFKTYGKM